MHSLAHVEGNCVQGERRNPLLDTQSSSGTSRKSSRTTTDPAESASSRFRSLFKRRDRTETS